MQSDYNRQREYLEKSVESLKRKFTKDMVSHRNDNMRLMRDSGVLTKEINALRRELFFIKQGKAAEATVTAANMKLLHAAFAKAS